jgi:Flp pilus assembly pilin Flp
MEKRLQVSAALLLSIWQEDEGQDLVEYALLLAFIALAAVAILGGVKTTTKGLWTTINSALSSASTTAS